eukprot:Rmarinus@m.16716
MEMITLRRTRSLPSLLEDCLAHGWDVIGTDAGSEDDVFEDEPRPLHPPGHCPLGGLQNLTAPGVPSLSVKAPILGGDRDISNINDDDCGQTLAKNKPVVVIAGSEACGMRRSVRQLCTAVVSIPMFVSSHRFAVGTEVSTRDHAAHVPVGSALGRTDRVAKVQHGSSSLDSEDCDGSIGSGPGTSADAVRDNGASVGGSNLRDEKQHVVTSHKPEMLGTTGCEAGASGPKPTDTDTQNCHSSGTSQTTASRKHLGQVDYDTPGSVPNCPGKEVEEDHAVCDSSLECLGSPNCGASVLASVASKGSHTDGNEKDRSGVTGLAMKSFVPVVDSLNVSVATGIVLSHVLGKSPLIRRRSSK